MFTLRQVVVAGGAKSVHSKVLGGASELISKPIIPVLHARYFGLPRCYYRLAFWCSLYPLAHHDSDTSNILQEVQFQKASKPRYPSRGFASQREPLLLVILLNVLLPSALLCSALSTLRQAVSES